MRSLTVRIVIAVIGTLLVSLVAFFATFRAMSVPANVRLIRTFQAHQIDQAVQTLREDGPGAAARFLDELNASLDATHHLTDASGRDLVTGEDRSELLRLPRPWFGPPQIDGRLVIVESSRDQQHRMVILAPPPFNIWAFVPYYALILAAVACLCWLLAIGIVRPLRQVSHAVKRFGHGDLAMRVHLARRDEIGDLGRVFNEMAERIATLVTAERRLLQDISHELRSPLARLNIAIELARQGGHPHAAADRLQREADRLTTLVGSLIEVTRLEGDPAAERPTDVSVQELVSTVVAGCELEAQARPCRIVVRHQADRLLFGHPELLRRALENVLRNAIRYAPGDSEVSIQVEDDGTATVIAVRDRGPGVPEADVSRLVQPFFRVDAARDAVRGGVGLGLSIAHRAMHLHHGSLRIENAHPGLRVSMTFSDQRTIDLGADVETERSPVSGAR
jgi:signal transduction histidine kinase